MTEKLSNLGRITFDKDFGEFFVGNDLPFDGEIIIQQFVQSDPADIWDINLNIEAEFIQAYVFVDNGDGTYSITNPKKIELISLESLKITFSSAITGLVNILLATSIVTGKHMLV